MEVNLTQSILDPTYGSFFGWENFFKDVSVNKNGLCFVELRSGTLNFLLGHNGHYMEWLLVLSASSFELSVKGEAFGRRNVNFGERAFAHTGPSLL